MVIPPEVTFRNMKPSAAIKDAILRRAAKLDRYHPRIISCRVVVELGHARPSKRRFYHVRADVRVAGAELVAKAEPPPQHHHEDVFIAIRDTFDSVRRELEDTLRRQRGYVKSPEPARAPGFEKERTKRRASRAA